MLIAHASIRGVESSRRTIRGSVRTRWLLDAVLGVAGCLALVLVVVSAAAGDAPGWSVQKVPAASVSPLTGVSCTSATACTAVGGALVERWSGARWRRQDVPVPPGTVGLHLSSVSCSSNTACMAVGSFSLAQGGADGTLAEHWDGNRWSYQLLPGPAGGAVRGISLSAVSCTSDRACTAVGNGGGYVSAGERPVKAG